MIKITFSKYFSIICFLTLTSSFCFGSTINKTKISDTTFEMSSTVSDLPENLPLTPDFTVMAKIKINTPGSTLFSWSNEEGEVFSTITVTDDYKLRFSIPSIGYSIDSDTSLETGCHHVAVVCDKGLITLYINGVEEISTQINLAELAVYIGTINPETIKGNLTSSNGCDISEFALFEDPLAQYLIQQYIASPPIVTSDAEIGLLLALNFNIPGMPFAGLSANFKAEICIALSSENANKAAFRVYPNPASDFIKVSKEFLNASYKVHDIIGKQIKYGKLGQSLSIDVKTLNQGIYFLSIADKYAVKFIKK